MKLVDRIRKSSIGKTITRLDLGKYKAWYQRVALYITGLNFLMIFYNFTQANKWLSWYGWLVVFALFIFFLLFIDILFIWESEQNATAQKNPVIREMSRKVEYLYKKEGGK